MVIKSGVFVYWSSV